MSKLFFWGLLVFGLYYYLYKPSVIRSIPSVKHKDGAKTKNTKETKQDDDGEYIDYEEIN